MASAPASTAARHLVLGLVLVAAAGLAIAGYLLATRLLGGPPVCLIGGGCDTVQSSEYATVLGIPVAAYGVAFSSAVAVAGIAWLRAGDRRALFVAWALGIVGTLGVAYLTYLELFVIEAICSWCIAYAVSVVAGLVLTGLALRATSGG